MTLPVLAPFPPVDVRIIGVLSDATLDRLAGIILEEVLDATEAWSPPGSNRSGPPDG